MAIGAADNYVDLCTLREGDADDSDQVNIADFAILAASYGKSTGQAGFDSRADFNESGQITIQDFSLLAASYGRFGDQACAGTSARIVNNAGLTVKELPDLL